MYGFTLCTPLLFLTLLSSVALAGCPQPARPDGGVAAAGEMGAAQPATNFMLDGSCKAMMNGIDEAAVLTASFAEAVRLARSGVTYFDQAGTIGHARYERWFGPWSQVVPVDVDNNVPKGPEEPRVEDNVRRIGRVITAWQFQLICRPMDYMNGSQCHKVHDYASAESADTKSPYRINVCPQFFSLTSTGVNSQASTIVHEVSHFVWNGNNKEGAALTDNINLSNFNGDLDAFATYSSSNPLQAYHDSYTHEFFLGTDPGQP